MLNIKTSNSFTYSNNDFRSTETIQKPDIDRTPELGTITVNLPIGTVRITSQQRQNDYMAACVVDGCIWFETAPTNAEAILTLTERLQAIS